MEPQETGLSAEEEIARELYRVRLDEDDLVAILNIELSVAERTLLDAGRGETIEMMRESYQLAIGPTFAAIVERATGRKVWSPSKRRSEGEPRDPAPTRKEARWLVYSVTLD